MLTEDEMLSVCIERYKKARTSKLAEKLKIGLLTPEGTYSYTIDDIINMLTTKTGRYKLFIETTAHYIDTLLRGEHIAKT